MIRLLAGVPWFIYCDCYTVCSMVWTDRSSLMQFYMLIYKSLQVMVKKRHQVIIIQVKCFILFVQAGNSLTYVHCFSTQQAKFEIYDLQYECQYLIRVNAVSQAGNLGKTSKTKLNTPVCEKILVKGNSLSPDCPHRGKELFLYPT